MVKWADYKTEAKGRGALAMELYVARSFPTSGAAPVKANLAEHLAYIRSLEENQQLLMAGPLSNESGQNMEGAGMIVLRAASMEEARRLAENDPMHKSGARSFTMTKWLVNEGSISLSVGLSTGRIDVG